MCVCVWERRRIAWEKSADIEDERGDEGCGLVEMKSKKVTAKAAGGSSSSSSVGPCRSSGNGSASALALLLLSHTHTMTRRSRRSLSWPTMQRASERASELCCAALCVRSFCVCELKFLVLADFPARFWLWIRLARLCVPKPCVGVLSWTLAQRCLATAHFRDRNFCSLFRVQQLSFFWHNKFAEIPAQSTASGCGTPTKLPSMTAAN